MVFCFQNCSGLLWVSSDQEISLKSLEQFNETRKGQSEQSFQYIITIKIGKNLETCSNSYKSCVEHSIVGLKLYKLDYFNL